MSKCTNKVIQYVPKGYGYKAIKTPCGSTSIHGSVLLCTQHEYLYNKLYPQGWRNVPGDICVHGTYVGDQGGADYICGYCEEEDY